MWKIIFVSVLALSICQEEGLGPAYNEKHKSSQTPCSRLSIEDGNNNFPGGVSDCIDLNLYDSSSEQYFDHCCYIRAQIKGTMYAGCIGLREEDYLDIVETKRKMEHEKNTIWAVTPKTSKIYDLQCYSTYLKAFSIFLLLAFLF